MLIADDLSAAKLEICWGSGLSTVAYRLTAHVVFAELWQPQERETLR